MEDLRGDNNRKGAWAVAVEYEGGSTTFGGDLKGYDRTAHAGERTAALHALEWADAAATPIAIVIDNKAVQRQVTRFMRRPFYTVLPRYSSALWSNVRGNCRRLARLQAHWVPSHYRAPMHIGTERARRLKDLADTK